MAQIPELFTGHFTIVCIAGLICLVFAVLSMLAYHHDRQEVLGVRDIIYFQGNITPTDFIYVVTFKIQTCHVFSGWTDLILRLRGSLKDSPLVLFRDYEQQYLRGGKTLSVGFTVPFDLGSVLDVNVASDNEESQQGASILTFSDLFVRKLPRKETSLGNMRTKAILKKGDSPFHALSKDVRTWASAETFISPKGRGILAISFSKAGKYHTVCARDAAASLHLQEEIPSLKQRTRIGFRPLNYIWSQFWPWHDSWSEYSHLDHMMVMWLDLTACIVMIASSYAFGVDRFLGAAAISGLLHPAMKELLESTPARSVEELDLQDLLSNFRHYPVCLILCAYMALLGSAFVIPLSLLWCRLFRLIGGKGFEKALWEAQPPEPETSRKNRTPHFSMGPGSMPFENLAGGNCLMLRTLECHATHTASCVTSSRRLRVEPLISNCPADHITARSIAYIRTKMTKLRQKNVPSGLSGLKHPDVLHESHTQSTDAPQMPPPKTAPDGSGDVVRISRYCERIVQQAVRQIHDNSVIAECFEVEPDIVAGGVTRKKKKRGQFANCCQARCCGPDGNPEESISNLTFFTEEDAESLKEMVEHMPTPSSSRSEGVAPHPPTRGLLTRGQILPYLESDEEEEDYEEEDNEHYDDDEEDEVTENYYDSLPTPRPSGKQQRKNAMKLSFMHAKDAIAEAAYKGPTEESNRRRHIKRGVRMLPPPKSKDYFRSEKRGNRTKRHVKKNKGVRFDILPEKKGEQPMKSREARKKKEKSKREKRDTQNVVKMFRERSRTGGKYPLREAPFPSGHASVMYDSVASDEWASGRSNAYAPPAKEQLARSAPYRGNIIKTCVFILLLLVQLGEILVVTVLQLQENKFFLRNTDGTSGPGAGRINSALVSCILAVIFYPLITVHVIALLSFLVDYLRLSTEKEPGPYMGGASSRHTLAPFP